MGNTRARPPWVQCTGQVFIITTIIYIYYICTHKQTNKRPNKQAHQQTNYKEAETEANKHTAKQRMEDIRKDCEQISNQERRTHLTGK